jgi:hypothetical protein
MIFTTIFTTAHAANALVGAVDSLATTANQEAQAFSKRVATESAAAQLELDKLLGLPQA